MSTSDSREQWVDIAKGLGIIAVVIGHSGNPTLAHYLYWFHMPLFFIVSGYLTKPISNWSEFKRWLSRRTLQMLIPYVAFLACFFILSRVTWSVFAKQGHVEFVDYSLLDAVIGGRAIDGLFAVFWFVTCFYFAQILINLILMLCKTTTVQVSFLIVLYALAHVESSFAIAHAFIVPWSTDVALMALVYVSVGYYSKPLLDGLRNKWIYVVCLLVSTTFMLCSVLGIVSYRLDLKNLGYTNPLLDLIVPVTFSFVVIAISKVISSYRQHVLADIGRESLILMYLHVPSLLLIGFILNRVTPSLLEPAKLPIVILFAIAFSYVIAKVMGKIPVFQVIFLGKIQVKQPPRRNISA